MLSVSQRLPVSFSVDFRHGRIERAIITGTERIPIRQLDFS